MKETFASRLRSLRIMKGYSFRELSEAMGSLVSAQTLANYESKVSFPDSDVMSILLRTLGVSYDDIFKPVRIKPEDVEFSFRKKQGLGKKSDESLRRIAVDKAEKYLEIEDILNVSLRQHPDISSVIVEDFASAENAAQLFRDLMNLGQDPIPNVYILLDKIGIKVFPMNFDSKFDALSFSYDGGHFIMVNTSLETNERIRFTLLHEVGHILMNIPDSVNEKVVEKLCHRFASNTLLPPAVLKERLGQKRIGIAPQELAYIQSEYGISIAAIMQSAKDQGIISEGNLTSYYKKVNVLPNFKEFVNKSRFCQEEAESGFESLVYRALSSEIISASKAAYLLGDSVENVVNHINML